MRMISFITKDFTTMFVLMVSGALIKKEAFLEDSKRHYDLSNQKRDLWNKSGMVDDSVTTSDDSKIYL